MQPCEICGLPGERHHIVFRSQGGLNIKTNYAYLCWRHHKTGPDAVHVNRELDLKLKLRLQRLYENLFVDCFYQVKDISLLIGYDRRRLQRRMKAVPHTAGLYKREDVIRFLMGGKLYDGLRPPEPEKEKGEEEWKQIG